MEHKISSKIRLRTLNIGTLNGKGFEICEDIWKRKVDLCCLQEVRWRGCGSRPIDVHHMRYG